jgi:peptidyl-prolyl cis-trans isomerase C
MNFYKHLSLAVLTALGAIACSDAPDGDTNASTDALGPGEVAVVNGERIPESLFRYYVLNALQADADDLTPEGRQEVIERLVYLKLLADDAESSGLHQERTIAAELELARMQLLARARTERYRSENPPTEAELRELYQANLPRLSSAQYKTRHILVETEDEAATLIEELQTGADFAALAQEHSTGPTGPDGGDLGWITAQSVVEPFAQAVETATPGEIVPTPVQTQYGWHVILVEEKEDQVPPGLDAVREDLIVAVETQKLDNYAAGLREAAEVVIVE